MTILFSALDTVETDGIHYFSNEIQASLNRYKHCCDQIVCLAHSKETDTPTSDPIDMNGVEFIFIHKINSLQSFLSEERLNGELIRMAISKSDACIIHVYSTHAAMVLKYAKRMNKPCVNVVVGDPWDSYWNYSLTGKMMAPFAYCSLRKMQRQAWNSIYVTNSYLQQRYPTKGYSIACSNVDMKTGDEQQLERRLAGIDSKLYEKIRIGTLAALNVRYKGQEYVIRAIKVLKDQGLNRFEYHLAGKGDASFLRSLVKRLGLNDEIVIHGAIPHAQVAEFLDETDVYIQPSKQEGLPRALIEAMSRGCLCLGSRTAGIPELLDKNYIFEKGDVKRIAKLLASISKDNFREEAKRNFEEAKKYDKAILNKRREDFLNSIFPNIVAL